MFVFLFLCLCLGILPPSSIVVSCSNEESLCSRLLLLRWYRRGRESYANQLSYFRAKANKEIKVFPAPFPFLAAKEGLRKVAIGERDVHRKKKGLASFILSFFVNPRDMLSFFFTHRQHLVQSPAPLFGVVQQGVPTLAQPSFNTKHLNLTHNFYKSETKFESTLPLLS